MTAIRRAQHRWVAGLVALVALVALAAAMPAGAAVEHLSRATMQPVQAPADEATGRTGKPASLPMVVPAGVAAQGALFRLSLTFEKLPQEAWAVFLPYLSYGGSLWVNGNLVKRLPENTPGVYVRMVRPHLATIPPAVMRAGVNEIAVQTAPPPAGGTVRVPALVAGPEAEIVPLFERRRFWVSVTPEITATVCLLVAVAVLIIWWRRRTEVMYGLFGVALALWGLRTLTFVIEIVPAQAWPWWRLIYLGATGGFIVVMTVLAWRLAAIRIPWFERSLVVYWALGPITMILLGSGAEPLVNRYWVAGFIPLGLSIVGVSLWSLARKRTLLAAALPVTMAIAALTGIHDYLVAWNMMPAASGLAGWAEQRIYLLHHGASLVLMTMGALITARFIDALSRLEGMNQTLESRVLARERELSDNYLRLSLLERERAAAQERQRIMRDIHDGLGSRLFVALFRVERGAMDMHHVAEALRGCIAEMRLALDTLAPRDEDFRATLGNFLFRWRDQLQGCGIHLDWRIDLPDQPLTLSPHAGLQLLRVAQEALTNVVKHSSAASVQVTIGREASNLVLDVLDDGQGQAAGIEAMRGHGMTNMRKRVEQLGGELHVEPQERGILVRVHVPLRVPAPAPAATMTSQLNATAHAGTRDVTGELAA